MTVTDEPAASQEAAAIDQPRPIAAVLDRMQRALDEIPPPLTHRRFFAETYLRTTRAVGDAVDQARFEDPEWVEQWDAVFAELYLTAATDEANAPRPWRLALAAPAELPQLRHVLLGINAHINYDLPQALLAVISDDDFADPVLMDRRRRDHQRIDGVLFCGARAARIRQAWAVTNTNVSSVGSVPTPGPAETLAAQRQ